MPSRRSVQLREDAPTRPRSERIRLRAEAAAAAAQAAEAARADPRVLRTARSSLAINRPRGRPRNRAAVGARAAVNLIGANGVPSSTSASATAAGAPGTAGALPPLVPFSRMTSEASGGDRTMPPLVPFSNMTSAATGAAEAVPQLEQFSPTADIMRGGTRYPTLTQRSERGAAERIQRELQNFMMDPPPGCHVEAQEQDIFNWKATILGPPQSPYEGGVFKLEMCFDEDYPFTPPKVVFLTKVYHCNISVNGNICLDILSTKWSPAMGAATVLLSIISLLSDPNPDDPLEEMHGDVYLRNAEEYEANARLWTSLYAAPDMDEHISE